MTLEKTELRNHTWRAADWHTRLIGKELNGTQPLVTYLLNSESGCRYELSVHPVADLAYHGGIVWSDASTFYPIHQTVIRMDGVLIDSNVSSTSPYARINASLECKGRDIILASTPWTAPIPSSELETMYPSPDLYRRSPDFRMRALLCESRYSSKIDLVKVSMGPGERTTLEHVSEPSNNATALHQDSIDLEGFQTLSTGNQWRVYFGDVKTNSSSTAAMDETFDFGSGRHSGGASGLGVILSMLSNFSSDYVIDDPDLVTTASRIKGRIFAEVLRNSLFQPGASKNVQEQGAVHVLEERVVIIPEMSIALSVLFMVSFLLLLTLLWFSRTHRRPLQLQSDPGSTVGLGALLNPQLTSFAMLRGMHSAKQQQISRNLRSETFLTSGGTLYEGNGVTHTRTPSKKMKKERDWRPRVIHLKNLFALCGFLLVILAAMLVLYTFATGSKLYQRAFIYETDLSKFGLSISSFTPISIAPAVISVVISLWWDQVDATFRLLQPYIGMQEPTPIYRGAGLTYRSKSWFGAAIKAAKHRHWLLFMVAIGSTLCQVLTVSMSALFERHMDNVSQQVPVNRTLQMRYHPIIQEITNGDPNDGRTQPVRAIDEMFQDSSSNWMFSAIAQITMNGSRPTWTKDEWSFLPLDLHQFINSSNPSNSIVAGTHNVTISTSAVRVRVECNTIPAIRNVSSWLGDEDIYYMEDVRKKTGLNNFTALRRYAFEGTPAFTTIFADSNKLQCCTNGTSNGSDTAAIGHWSPTVSDNTTSFPYVNEPWPMSFVTKWIVGKPMLVPTKISSRNEMIFVEQPQLQAALCKPVIEITDASALVNQATGTVLSYTLEGSPVVDDAAWSQVFLLRSPSNTSRHYDNNKYIGLLNVTTSFGVLFFDTLFGAADRTGITIGGGTAPANFETLTDNVFNFRDVANGLNMDLMTYSMYAMAGRDSSALLNYTTLVTNANRTLQTFFQHFVQAGVSMTTGGYAYQGVEDRTMTDLGRAIDTNGAPISQPVYSVYHAERTGMATVTSRIQILYMNPVATFLSVGILTWLIGTAVVIICLQRRYTRSMMRNVEVIADVLVLIAGSDNFLSLVQERGIAIKQDRKVCTKLGWFKDRRGQVRWGVEVVGGRNAVEWVDAPKQGII
ncbi:hypothetical protein DPSP01_004655 [Paraphaeosphaeria sporulosa]